VLRAWLTPSLTGRCSVQYLARPKCRISERQLAGTKSSSQQSALAKTGSCVASHRGRGWIAGTLVYWFRHLSSRRGHRRRLAQEKHSVAVCCWDQHLVTQSLVNIEKENRLSERIIGVVDLGVKSISLVSIWIHESIWPKSKQSAGLVDSR